jgi:hypothetical protein
MLLGYWVHVLAEVLLQYLRQKNYVGAVYLECCQRNPEGFDVVAFLGIVFEVVLLGSQGEATD